MPNDSELLRRYVDQDDESAFAELVQRNLGVVFNAALRRVNGNPHLAEEAAQLVFTQLACKAHRLVHHSALLGWLHTSTRYAASAIVRREQRHAARQSLATAMQLDDADNTSTAWESLRPLIDEALDHLQSHDRQAILLRYFANRSFADIGRELRVSEDASRKRVERAVELLRRQLARRGVTTSASALAIALVDAPAIAAPSTLAATITATATTAAATGGSIASAFFGFMGTTKVSGLAVVACSLVGLATLGTAVVTWSEQIDREARQLDAMRTEASAIRSRLRKLGDAQWGKRQSADAQASGAVNAPRASAASEWAAELLSEQQLLATSAVYAPIREQTFRLLAQREFGAFFAARHYSADKAERVRQGLIRYYDARETQTRLFNMAGSGGTGQLKASLEQEQQRFLDGLRSTLPDKEVEDIGRCFAAQRTLPGAREVSLDLADAGAPLDRVQELSLAMILADSAAARSASPEARKLARAVDPKTGLSTEDRVMLDDATAFLSPTQLKFYERYLRQEHVRSALSERARAQVASASPHP